MESVDFRDFMASAKERNGRVWDCGVDEHALRRLAGRERQKAEDVLLELAARGDTRGVCALARLGTTRAADIFRERVKKADAAWERIRLGYALWLLDRDPNAIRLLDEGLCSKWYTDRSDAAFFLEVFPRDQVIPRLVALLSDENEHVRGAAVLAMLRIHGLAQTLSYLWDYAALLAKVRSKNPLEWEAARRELLDIVGHADEWRGRETVGGVPLGDPA